MKLAIRKASNKKNIEDLLKKIDSKIEQNKISEELVDILMEDKEFSDLKNKLAVSRSSEEADNLKKQIKNYVIEKAKVNPNFMAFLNHQKKIQAIFDEYTHELEALAKGESKNLFIRELKRLLFFGPPNSEKSLFFGFLFMAVAGTGVLGTVIGNLLSQGMRDWFDTVYPFGIPFIKNIVGNYSTLLNIGFWYSFFEILGFKSNQLRNQGLKLKEIEEIGLDKKSSVEDGSYMAIQNLKTIKMNVERLMRISKNPKFGPMITNEHAWAADHLAVAAENIDQVTDFFEAQFEFKAKKV